MPPSPIRWVSSQYSPPTLSIQGCLNQSSPFPPPLQRPRWWQYATSLIVSLRLLPQLLTASTLLQRGRPPHYPGKLHAHLPRRLGACEALDTAVDLMTSSFCDLRIGQFSRVSLVKQLSALMTPLSQKDPAQAQKISEGMMAAMTQNGDEACASLDKLIAQAK